MCHKSNPVTLIKSISGIRGTIGGAPGDALTPLDVVKFTAAFGSWVIETTGNRRMVLGRDARISGDMVNKLVVATLQGLGMDVMDAGLSTTPTVEMLVPAEKAGGGIILTASHNPKQWNALKLLNAKGEFISGEEGAEVLRRAEAEDFSFAEVDDLGKYETRPNAMQDHIDAILKLPLVDADAIRRRGFKIAVDAVNSTGGIAIPRLLKALGVETVYELYCDPTGHFPHNPEPLPEHLVDIAALVKEKGADLGIVVDPDVDRLAIVNEDGTMFGEEYTLVAVSDYILQHTPGNTVSNLSSTRALRDITESAGKQYFASAVGEVNVVLKMKAEKAVIGGEGNGGIIYPALHYGRDALVGVALLLTYLAKNGKTASALRASYPPYVISKNKIELTPSVDVDAVLEKMRHKYADQEINTADGVRIDFPGEWVHFRKSNTEPIIRIYAESKSAENADALAQKMIQDIKNFLA